MRPVEAITPIHTGEMRIKRTQRHGYGPIGVRHLRTMLSRDWLDPLPIFAWLIDHRDGPILVDTGPTPSDAWSYPRFHPFYPLAYRTRVPEGTGLEHGLELASTSPDELSKIVLTHCHPDHTGGLDLVPDVPVVMPGAEYQYAHSIRGRLWGAHPSLTPAQHRTQQVELDDGPRGPFRDSYQLTSGITLVPTPGHTAHHCSVLVEGEGPPVLLAADALYDLEQLQSKRADGVATRVRAGRRSIDTIDRWGRATDGIILPSHDPTGPERLRDAQS